MSTMAVTPDFGMTTMDAIWTLIMNQSKTARRKLSKRLNEVVAAESDVTKTKGYQEAMQDKQQGRIYHAESVDDMFNHILGEGWRIK